MSSLSGVRAVSHDRESVTPNPGELVANLQEGWAAIGGDDVTTPFQAIKRLGELIQNEDGFERVGIDRKAWQNPAVIAWVAQQNIEAFNGGKPFSPFAPIPFGQVLQTESGTPLQMKFSEGVRLMAANPDYMARLQQEAAAGNVVVRGGNPFNPARGPTALSTILPVGREPGDPRI